MIDRIIERAVWTVGAATMLYFGAHWLAYLVG